MLGRTTGEQGRGAVKAYEPHISLKFERETAISCLLSPNE
jgi:hypothetical protein